MSEMNDLVKMLFLPKLRKISTEAKSDQDRSKKILEYLVTSLVNPGSVDPVDIDWQITDGASDGGLDAYVADPVLKTLRLFQCKWFSKPSKISERDSMDLYGFYVNKLLKDDRTNLNDLVRFVLAKFQDLWKEWKCELVYVTNGSLDETARRTYKSLANDDGRCGFRLVDEMEMGSIWYKALSSEKPIGNEMVIAVRPDSSFQAETAFPSHDGIPAQKIRVIQCMLAAEDLVRAYAIYQRDLLIRNLRYGLAGNINQRMKETAESEIRSAFYVFHNGISIVCSKFDLLDFTKSRVTSDVADILQLYPSLSKEQAQYIVDSMGEWGRMNFIYLKDLQIVNGGQSTVTLSKVEKSKLKDISVPCKISETTQREIAQYIAIYNNTQNKITPADLVANTDEQSFLQNFAALEIDPPIFYQRKEREQWTDIFRVRGPAPLKERWVEYEQVYQAFLSWTGKPGPAYTRKASLISGGDAPYYRPITNYPKKDIMLVSGLITNYEKILHREDGKKTPEFVEYWTQWAVAALGHIWRYVLDTRKQEELKSMLLSSKGLESWKHIRKTLIELFENVFDELPKYQDAQRFLKNDEEEFVIERVETVKPNDVARYVPPAARGPTLKAMKGLYSDDPPSLDYYDIYFAVFAAVIDKLVAADGTIVDELLAPSARK